MSSRPKCALCDRSYRGELAQHQASAPCVVDRTFTRYQKQGWAVLAKTYRKLLDRTGIPYTEDWSRISREYRDNEATVYKPAKQLYTYSWAAHLAVGGAADTTGRPQPQPGGWRITLRQREDALRAISEFGAEAVDAALRLMDNNNLPTLERIGEIIGRKLP